MATVHFLNVSPGDCTVIQHASGRVSVIDICDGNINQDAVRLERSLERLSARGNFGMTEYPTNPIRYMQGLNIANVFRFILTHPDMDHMDGLDAMYRAMGIENFWHTGVTRERPDFGFGGYRETDWKIYQDLLAGHLPNVKVLQHLAGARFAYANMSDDGQSAGDGLYILAPDAGLVDQASHGDINDGSYVLLYRSAGGRILIPGDAHDRTWEYVLTHYAADVANCSVLIAPHHGRHSDRSFEFLDAIKPKLTLFGSAPSEHLAYDAWRSRGLPFITSNQAGNVVLDIDNGAISVFVENDRFAAALGTGNAPRNAQGYLRIVGIAETPERTAQRGMSWATR